MRILRRAWLWLTLAFLRARIALRQEQLAILAEQVNNDRIEIALRQQAFDDLGRAHAQNVYQLRRGA